MAISYPTSADYADEQRQADEELARIAVLHLRSVKHGHVTFTIHGGKVTYIEVSNKVQTKL